MGEFSHLPSAGMDPADEPLEPGWGADLPDGRGPESVRRFDDHHVLPGYPPPSMFSISRGDGFWEHVRKRPIADTTATAPADDAMRIPPPPEAPASGRVGESDPPPREGIFRLPPFWRKPATLVLVPVTIIVLILACVLLLIAAVLEGVRAGWREFWDSAAERFDLRDVGRTGRLVWRAFLLAWRGE